MVVRSEVQSRRGLWRSRWAAIGAAVAVMLGGGGLFAVQAASSPASSVVTIDPVRVLDTRTDLGLVGPFVSAVSQKLKVTGAAVPAGASGVLLNVTVVAPTAAGFVSIRPGNATGAPSTSSLNFTAGDIVSNAVQVGLPTTGTNAGKIDIMYDAYGQAGPTTDVLVDVVGYMVAGGGGTGADGAQGPRGADGAQGPRGFSAWDEIPAGQTVTGSMIWDSALIADNADHFINVQFPGKAAAGLTNATINFATDALPITGDDDSACLGSVAVPTAPAGKVCIYLLDWDAIYALEGRANNVNTRDGFTVRFLADGDPGDDMFVNFSWAYTR
jgi:hypothetical protein